MFKWLYQKIFEGAYRFLHILGYRFVEIPLIIRGIGHQITEPCTLIKRQRLGLVPPHYKFIVVFSMDLTHSKFQTPHLNIHLIKYLKKYFSTLLFEYSSSKWEKIKFSLLAPFVYPEIYGLRSKEQDNLRYPVNYYMSDTQSSGSMFETNRFYSKKLFEITRKDERYARKILEKLQVPQNAWFVTFHYRDSVFYNKDSFWEKNYNNRCVDVESYFEACQKIIEKGGWCFRVASKKSNPLPEKFKSLKKVIDISDVCGDVEHFSVFLFSKCKFFLGCNSGPSLIPGYFGVPVVQVQTAPFYGLPIHKFDIFTYKKYWHLEEKRHLKFSEMFASPYCHLRLDEDFKKHNIRIDDNTSSEVLDVVSEIMNRELINPSKSITHAQNTSIFGSPIVYCYKAASSVSKSFEKSNKNTDEL
ncbi:MAG: hypothetical protein S4CHLAM6_03570 [Chlamydiae bacterium]|nr:hypothetical protein [Chlamydiota bacterium]